MNSSSVFLIVNIQVTNAFTQIKQPGVTAAAALLTEGNIAAFQQQYGDMFVRGMQTGGCFFGVIEIITTSSTDQQDVSAKVSAAYGPFGAAGTFSDSFKEAVTNRQVKVTCHIEGGNIPDPLPTNIDMLINAAGDWPRTVALKAVPYSAMLDGYGVLPLPNPPNFIDLQHQQDVLTQCSLWRNQDRLTLNDLDYIKKNPHQFILPSPPQLDQWQNSITQDLNTIATTASNALNNPAQAQLPTLHLPPPVQLPLRVVAPSVTGLSPSHGRPGGGDSITVTGTAFTGATRVSFGPAAGTDLAVASDTQLTVTSPPNAGGASVDITVTTPAGASAASPADMFTYVAQPPSVTGLSASHGRPGGGDSITVTGTAFTGATRVSFGPAAGTDLAVASDTQLTVTSPPNASSEAVDVTVTTPAGTSAASPADMFTYAPPPPIVTGLSPSAGRAAGGDSVAVTGTGFTGATTVSFGPAAGTNLAVASDTQLTVTSPPNASSAAVDVTVTTPAGSSGASPADRFTYAAPPPLRVLTSSLPEAVCGQPYSTQLQASGGFGTLTWALASGSLPTGLSLTPTGVISGNPDPHQNPPGNAVFVVADSTGTQNPTAALTIHLAGRRVPYTAPAIDQNSSGHGDRTQAYTIPPPQPGAIDTSTVHITAESKTDGAARIVGNPQITQDAVTLTIYTQGQGLFNHSGQLIVTVSFIYITS